MTVICKLIYQLADRALFLSFLIKTHINQKIEINFGGKCLYLFRIFMNSEFCTDLCITFIKISILS